MSKMPIHKYRTFAAIDLPARTWPSRVLARAPLWCSVDLRDGNQALVEPMGPERKLRMWKELVRMGFKQIEVGFPAASQPDFDFVRHIIDQGLIPDDVTIQVLTQARPELITRSFEAIRGSKRAIMHLYNSTSTLQRRVVFNMDRAAIRQIAVDGTHLVKQLADAMPETDVQLQYSPESFTGTELDFAQEVCDAVMEAWGACSHRQVILNLPATVEMATPNIYADQVEWMSTHLVHRAHAILSVHPHNDRGTAVAAAELALMAGADRVEGTLFGNGERTGNVDLITLSLNLFSQGIDPELDVSDIDGLKRMVEHVNRLPVHPRHPYAGELVYTAFSGSHQDAIKKGFAAREHSKAELWEVPYLPIDPADVGRSYEAVIRVNSQSGKSGVAYVLEQDFGYVLPKPLSVELSQEVQAQAERSEGEVSPDSIRSMFERSYVNRSQPLSIRSHASETHGELEKHRFAIQTAEGALSLESHGKGPLDAFVRALSRQLGALIQIESYAEHALGAGADAQAVAYVALSLAGEQRAWGVGSHESIVTASLSAIISALNRAGVASSASETAAAE